MYAQASAAFRRYGGSQNLKVGYRYPTRDSLKPTFYIFVKAPSLPYAYKIWSRASSLLMLPKALTNGQSNPAKAASNPSPPYCGETKAPRLYNVPRGRQEFSQHRILICSAVFVKWSRIGPRDRETDWRTDRLTDRQTSRTSVCIPCSLKTKSLHYYNHRCHKITLSM